MIARHSLVARDLLHKIPRLETVAEIVARQAPDCGMPSDETIDIGGRILGAAAELEQALSRGEGKASALARISESPANYGRDVIDALAMATLRGDDAPVEAVPISELQVGMVLCSDIRSEAGGVIASGGYVSVNTGSAPDANEIPVPKADADVAMDAAACIGCGACVAQCPNSAAQLFTSAKVSHLGILPQGQPERWQRVADMVGQIEGEAFGSCTNHRECEAVCPKEISVSAIARLNRAYVRASAKKG